jgi:hypothetical protein
MKQKLVAVLFAFAGVIAFSQTDAQARPHKSHHHSVHRAAHKHRAAVHVPRGLRRHGRRARSAAARGGRPGAWCGWWLGHHLGMPRRDLWVARNWARIGRNAGGPRIGAVVVWRHHVGIITGRAGAKWVVKSGNDGNRVRERPRSIAGAIAFRHPGGGAAGS